MIFSEGLEKFMLEKDLPVTTFYDPFVLGYRLFHAKALDGVPLKRLPHGWDQTRAKKRSSTRWKTRSKRAGTTPRAEKACPNKIARRSVAHLPIRVSAFPSNWQ
ncbi:hypothetical protein [Solirhodobacter olei]|uniref:hypothetical protein n=1 Tax=Solirhodobacter olei TaxID=2493082 RepID=UPI0013E31F59|nr:hypothetical protein [Solirhodobacter olei]